MLRTSFQQHTQATLISLICLFKDLTSHPTNGGKSVIHLHVVVLCVMHAFVTVFSIQDIPRSPVFQAAAFGHFAMVKYLIQKYKCDWQKINKVSVQSQSICRDCTDSYYLAIIVLAITVHCITVYCTSYYCTFIYAGWMDSTALCCSWW